MKTETFEAACVVLLLVICLGFAGCASSSAGGGKGELCTGGAGSCKPGLNCVDGFCCEGACDGVCEACGSDGDCGFLPAGQDPDDECPDLGECLAACDGSGACRIDQGQGEQASCVAQGEACASVEQCETGHCVDGYCCDQACDGVCRGCDGELTDAAAGTCGFTVAGEDPAGECEGDGVCVAGFSCDGEGGCMGIAMPDHSSCELITTPLDLAHDICLEGACISPGICEDAGCNVPGPHFAVPPDERHRDFTRSTGAQPLVTDNLTLLTWQGCAAGLSGDDCAGLADGYTWIEALSYCDGLAWGGHDDWYLPDEYELQSIIDYSIAGPAVYGPAFPNPQDFWSSSSSARDSALAWGLVIMDGALDTVPKTETSGVLCVRAGVPIGEPQRFERTGETKPIVWDFATGLMWQGCAAGLRESECLDGAAEVLGWSDAFTICQGMQWAGYADWRVPDVKELRSIIDNRRNDPALDAELFPNTPTGWSWSGTSYSEDSTQKWVVNFTDGRVTHSQLASATVRCVRDM